MIIEAKKEEEKVFYFKGRWFPSVPEGYKYIEEFYSSKICVNEFNALFDNLKQELWLNIAKNKIELTNGDLKEICEDRYHDFMKRITAKKKIN